VLTQEFVRNALLAGSAIAIASGAVGYFVVLRAQVFAGDALSHVAFTASSQPPLPASTSSRTVRGDHRDRGFSSRRSASGSAPMMSRSA
jgi:hypothetical protein